MNKDTTYIQGKVALLYKARERVLGLLSSTIEVFRQAELRDGEALQLLAMHMGDELASPSGSDEDDDSLSSSGSDED